MADLKESIEALTRTFCGRLLQSADDGYDDARRLFNGMIDRRPTLIAQCLNLADVCDAVTLGREQNLEIAVRGGGHNVAGRSTVDDGLMIDLSPMRSVHVDRRARTATAGGGATWLDFNRATQLFGLATTGGVVSTTGVAGLTLGGGFGWLMPKYGMALDNLRSVDLVTADGAVVRAAADENPDLFWGVRGGGGNFGVATSFEFQLHDVGPTVYGGLVMHPYAEARAVLRFFRDFSATVSDDVFLVTALLTGPDGDKLCAIAAAHCGSLEDGEKALAPLKGFGSPVADMLGPIPYSQLNMMLDEGMQKGFRNYWKSHFLSGIDDATIDAFVGAFDSCPSPMSQALFEHFHGAVTRVPPAETAFAIRSGGYNSLALSFWSDQADDEANITWARDVYAALQPFRAANRYANYMDQDDTGDETLAAVYGPNLPRLRELKRKYDPDNVFHLNLNVPPA